MPIPPGVAGTSVSRLIVAWPRTACSTLLAFSVGMKLTITVINVVIGFLAIFLTLGTVRYGSVVSGPPAESADEPR